MNRFLYSNRRDGDEPELLADEAAVLKRLGEDFPEGDHGEYPADYVTVYEAIGNSFVERTFSSKTVFSLDPRKD